MIPIFKIACIGAALLMLVALPLFYVFKNRKDSKLMMNMMYGLFIYLLTSLILNMLVSLVYNPQDSTSAIGTGLGFAIMNGASFIVAAIAVLSFGKKKNLTFHPGHAGVGFMILFIFATVPILLNYFMYSFAINSGSLGTAVEGITQAQIDSITKLIVDASPIYFINFFTSRLFEFAVYSYAALNVWEGIEKNTLPKSVLTAFVVIFALYVIPSVIVTFFNSDIVVLVSQGIVAAYCFSKLKPWLLNS